VEKNKILYIFLNIKKGNMSHKFTLEQQVTLWDVTLVVQGRNCMFTTRMRESMSHEVELRSVEPEIIELLIDFIYTARISVNSSNVQSLLDAANQYQIEPVKKMCVEFLKGQIDPTNCLGISALDAFLSCVCLFTVT
uniref:BTB domain-containing protein n=1 Tax=Oryzias latipes TaxID=8090 RepID=A0A3P9JRN8_ORYLA